MPWTFFASSLQGGAASVVANGAIVKRVRMPVQLLPAASVLSALVNLLASGAVLLGVLAIFGPRHPEGLAWLPLLIAVQLVLGLGFAYTLAALNVYFRDVEHILSVLLLAWYFLTPVLFPVAILADRPRELALLYLNPMTGVIVGWQRALLDGQPPQWDALAYTVAFDSARLSPPRTAGVVSSVVSLKAIDRTPTATVTVSRRGAPPCRRLPSRCGSRRPGGRARRRPRSRSRSAR